MDGLNLKTFEEWKSTGEMTSEMAGDVYRYLDEILEKEFRDIEELIDKEPYVAFGRLMSLSFFLNAAIGKRPLILKKLEKWIKAVKNTLSKLATKVGAVGFNISVGFPAGVSIGLSFSVSP